MLHRTEHQKNDLVEIFKSQASIAKDLPILLKREQAHKEFLEDIVPFEEHLERGIQHKEIVEASIKVGRQLLGALKHLKETEEEKQRSLEKDIERLNSKLVDLRFQKDNLEYAKAHRDVLDWEKKLEEEKQKYTAVEEVVSLKQERKDELSFQLLLKEWHENEQSIGALSQQIATLEQNSGLEQVNQRMEEIKEEVKDQWLHAYQSIQETVKQYLGYQKFLMGKASELSQQDGQKTKDIAKLMTEIDFLYTGMHTFDAKEVELTEEFGDRVSYDLKSLIENLTKQLNDNKVRLDELQGEEKLSIEKQNQLAETLGTLNQSIKHSEEKCDELREGNEKQEERETKLYGKLHGLLADVSVPFTPSLLSNYALKIEEMLDQNRQQEEEIKKELWESQLDHALNDEHFWIANRDVKELKEWIDEKTGIDVFYGTQYLQSLTTEEMAQHLISHPLLPYGLVVNQHQWKKINVQVLSGRLFKSPVPIFLREEMNNADDDQPSFILINGKERELITDHSQFTNWKIKVEEEIEDKNEALVEIAKTETTLRRILKEIDRFLANELSIDIEKAIHQEEGALQAKKVQLQEITRQEEKEKELQFQLKDKLEKTLKKIESLSKDLEILKDFEQERISHGENKRVKEEKEKQKDTFVLKQQEIEKELETINGLQTQWNQTYVEWKLKIELNIKEIAVFIEGAVFPVDEKVDKYEETPRLSLRVLDEINGRMEELKQLQKSKEEQARELLVIQAKKETEQKQQKKLERKMNSQQKDWKESPEPDEPIEILENMLKTAKKDLKEAGKEEREQGTIVTKVETTLELATEQRKVREKGSQT